MSVQKSTVLKTGKSLRSYLDDVINESMKNALYQSSLNEKDKQDAVSKSSNSVEKKTEEKPIASKTVQDSDDEALSSGAVSVDDVVEKLNSIRSGRSFKDEKVNATMTQYVESLTSAEKTALLAFLKGIAQIVTGEVPATKAVDPSDNPADVKMNKSNSPHIKHVEPNVIKASSPKVAKKSSAEDDSGPVPITPKKK